ncbi:MAG: hypothetical protein R2789_09895 [Microthrixaceae bacterium]
MPSSTCCPAVGRAGQRSGPHVWLVAGFLAFFLLEQFLHWHHCHKAVRQHRPLGYLILADGLHNFIGGLAVGGAFIVDIRVGVVTWVVAALHEIPGLRGLPEYWCTAAGAPVPRSWNLASALTFLVGGLTAY